MTDAAALAQEFWWRMGTNRWRLAADLFADNIKIVWPQSGETIGSADDFVAINENYPSHGAWSFKVRRVLGSAGHAITETEVSDGTVEALAVSIFECADDQIVRITEYWPEPFAAPQWRRAWVSMDSE